MMAPAIGCHFDKIGISSILADLYDRNLQEPVTPEKIAKYEEALDGYLLENELVPVDDVCPLVDYLIGETGYHSTSDRLARPGEVYGFDLGLQLSLLDLLMNTMKEGKPPWKNL